MHGRMNVKKKIKWDVHVKHLSCILCRSYYVMQSRKGKTTINILRSV